MTFLKRHLNRTQQEIRCYNIIDDTNDKRYGEQCNRLLIKPNSQGEVAGQIVCPVCKIKYEMKNNQIAMIEKFDSKQKKYIPITEEV